MRSLTRVTAGLRSLENQALASPANAGTARAATKGHFAVALSRARFVRAIAGIRSHGCERRSYAVLAILDLLLQRRDGQRCIVGAARRLSGWFSTVYAQQRLT